jgi:predicted Ser/Thr protein kinase
MAEFDYRQLLGYTRRESLHFSQFVEVLMEHPKDCLRTSSALISEAIQHFGFDIVVRSGEPAVSYRIFQDPFANGVNAVFGQEFCIKQVVDVIESVGKESGPNRGIVLVGPPASGKTNIVDLISLALEEYTKLQDVRLYTFYLLFQCEEGRRVEFRPPFMHNPVLLFPTSLQLDHEILHPRQQLFDAINARRGKHEQLVFPTYYLNASLDKRSLDILEGLQANPRNAGKTLSEIVEEYVRVEEVVFSNAQAKGIANIDDMRQLKVGVHPVEFGQLRRVVVNEHLPGTQLFQYEGATVAANRGLLHIHDAFGAGTGASGPAEEDYKPLLMLLGSGRASVESTQTSVDATAVLTTNIEEMALLEKQLTSSKLLDRIEEIPVNYLLDANSEMEILRRDLANMREKYDVDPNLLRMAAYYSVLTRLLPPCALHPRVDWPEEKRKLYFSITPEQKLFIYACQPEDPAATIRRLPHWHPFRSEMIKRGINIHDTETFPQRIAASPGRITLEQSGVFTQEQLNLIDDPFMRELWNEHYPEEGKHGMSVRQLQNIMRDTISHSDGFRVHVGTFFSQLRRVFAGGLSVHHWLPMDESFRQEREPAPLRYVGETRLAEGEGDYGDFPELAKVAQALYHDTIRQEITVATVNRDPEEIAADLRRYLQHALLAKAHGNRAFAHVMIPRYTYVDPLSGTTVDRPDTEYLQSIEGILQPEGEAEALRAELAERFLDLQSSGELQLEEGRSVVTSRDDRVLGCFSKEYQRLLSHRRTMGEVSAGQLTEAFFHRRREPARYEGMPAVVREMVDTVLLNLRRRYHYSQQSALDTVVFALRKQIIEFETLIS